MSGTLAKRPSNEEEDSSLPQEPTPRTFPFVFQEPKNALGNDALQLQDRLAERVQSWERPRPVSEPEVVKVPDDKSTERGLIVRRVAKTVLALALALALGWTPLQRLLQSTSSEATVNARLITLRAPINGEISLPRQLADAGTPVLAGDEILRIVNRRADRAHLDDLRRTIDGIKSESEALVQRKQQLEGLLESRSIRRALSVVRAPQPTHDLRIRNDLLR